MADGGVMQQQEFSPDTDDPRRLRDALGRFATGVTVVTIRSDSGPMGFVANSFAAVSLDPALVLWSPARASRRFAHFARARDFAVHVLPRDALQWVARFGSGGAGFDGLEHGHNAQGVPVLPDVLARFDCRQHATHDGGDHLIIIGRVLRAQCSDGAPLIFSQGQYGGFDANSA